MARVQLALDVTDLEASVAFYTKLFGVGPAKRKPGYANFAIADPPLKLVLFESAVGGTLNHLGVETEGATEVEAADARLRGDGSRDHRRRRHDLLLRGEGRDLGHRSRRCPVGVVREDRRRRRARERFRCPGRRGVLCDGTPVGDHRGHRRGDVELLLTVAAATGGHGRRTGGPRLA